MTEALIYVVFLIVALVFNGWFTIRLYHSNNRRMEKKFLRHLKIEYPDSVITLSAVESTDQDALLKIKEQLDASS